MGERLPVIITDPPVVVTETVAFETALPFRRTEGGDTVHVD